MKYIAGFFICLFFVYLVAVAVGMYFRFIMH